MSEITDEFAYDGNIPPSEGSVTVYGPYVGPDTQVVLPPGLHKAIEKTRSRMRANAAALDLRHS